MGKKKCWRASSTVGWWGRECQGETKYRAFEGTWEDVHWCDWCSAFWNDFWNGKDIVQFSLIVLIALKSSWLHGMHGWPCAEEYWWFLALQSPERQWGDLRTPTKQSAQAGISWVWSHTAHPRVLYPIQHIHRVLLTLTSANSEPLVSYVLEL